jgi:hypothetical protein
MFLSSATAGLRPKLIVMIIITFSAIFAAGIDGRTFQDMMDQSHSLFFSGLASAIFAIFSLARSNFDDREKAKKFSQIIAWGMVYFLFFFVSILFSPKLLAGIATAIGYTPTPWLHIVVRNMLGMLALIIGLTMAEASET